MGRRKDAKRAAQDAKERAVVLKDQAKEVAGQSTEALKDFADQTGSAAKEFANKAKDAAKELVEQIDKAAKGVTDEEPRRGRKVLKTLVAVGAGIAILSNERARSAIRSLINRGSTQTSTPEIWRPAGTNGDNSAKTAATIAEETS
jgi:glycerol dehydrogenase-like iron-containing ADH family enzyme